MEIGKLVRPMAWALGVCVGVVVLAYALLFAINWSDEAPSADAVALHRIVASKPDVPDAANAWVFNLGLAAPEGQDPSEQGRERKAYLEQFKPSKDHPYPMLPGRENRYKEARSPATQALVKACWNDPPECTRLVHGDFAQVDAWLASENWLLERFTRMEDLREWKEVVPKDLSTPIGELRHAINGQQLLHMQAWKQARAGDGDSARAMLDRDFVFWRMVLRSSDSLLSKMVAASALDRNLTMGNLVLRDLHAAGKTTAPPTAWTQPFTREERSMRRAFAGEYVFQTSVLASLTDQPGFVSPNRFKDALVRPMFQLHATTNLTARDFVRILDRFDADYPALPAAAEASHAEATRVDENHYAYNAFGRVLYGIGASADMGNYATRVNDLEGVRRMALTAADMRASAPDASNAEDRVRNARWKDPYTNAPFAWDAKTASIVFVGLERGERGRHAMVL